MVIQYFLGIIFGAVVGMVMRLPGADAVPPAFAINLSVMASLWLGMSFAAAEQRNRSVIKVELFGAMIAYVCAAAALQHSHLWIILGFIFQAFWSALHAQEGFGASSRPWFPIFSVGANKAFAVCFIYFTILT